MKISLRSFFPVVSLLVSLSAFSPSGARASASGGICSGGGDGYAAEFVHIGNEIFNMLKRKPIRGVSLERLERVLQQTRVFSKEKVVLNGRELDAINTPAEKKVVLSRSRWRELRDAPRNRLVLVAHEYFSLMGLNDKSYAISNSIFDTPGNPLISYTCEGFVDFGPFGKNTLNFLIFNDFYLAYISDENGYALDSTAPGSMAPIYTYNLSKAPTDGDLFDVDAWAGEFLVTTNVFFTTRIISLPYLSKMKSGKFNVLDVESLSPLKISKRKLYCKVTQH